MTAGQFLKALYIAGFMAGQSTALQVISMVQKAHSVKSLSFRRVTGQTPITGRFLFCTISLERNLTIDTTFLNLCNNVWFNVIWHR